MGQTNIVVTSPARGEVEIQVLGSTQANYFKFPPAIARGLAEALTVQADKAEGERGDLTPVMTCSIEWIPFVVKDGEVQCDLPDDDEDVLVCDEAGNVFIDQILHDGIDVYWDSEAACNTPKIVAWAYLPPPYKAKTTKEQMEEKQKWWNSNQRSR